MPSYSLSFSKARESLTSVLDRVEKTGEPVTILRRGKPAVVIVSHEMFERRFRKPKRQWQLAGSIEVKRGVDVDDAIRRGREKAASALRARSKR